MDPEELKSAYPELLRKYLLEGKEEEALYGAYKLGKECFEAKIGIEDIMHLHTQCLEDIIKTIPPSGVHEIVLKSSNLLIEFSIRFGLVCQNYFEMLQQADERIRNAFYQAGEALTAGLDTRRMLSVILGIVKNLTEAAGCAIMLLEENKTIIRASEGLDTENEFFKNFLFEVIKEGKTNFVYDLREIKSQMTLKDGREIRSVLALPMNLKSKTRGVLGIYLTAPHRYEEKEIYLLTSFAYQAASAIDNAYFFKELQRHSRMFKALYDIDRVVSQSPNMDEMLSGTLETVMQIMGADGSGISLMDEEGKNLHLKVYKGLSRKFVEGVKTIKIGTGVSWQAVKLKKPVAIDISHYPTSHLIPMFQEEGVKSLAGTPIIFKDRILGTINIHYRRQHTFSQEELDLFASIGNELGVAVENARLYETERKAEEELIKAKELSDALNNINAAINSTLDFDEIMQRVVVESGKALATEASGILLHEGNFWVVRHLYGLPEEMVGMKFTDQEVPHIALAAYSKKPVSINDVYHDERINRDIVERFGLKSVLIVPMMVREEVIGIIGFNYHSAPVTFTEAQIDFASKLATSVSLATENSRLFSELKLHDKRLDALYSIESVVSRSLYLEEIFNVALSKSLEVTDTEAGTLYSFDGEVLRLEAVVGFSPEFKEKAIIRKIGNGIPGIAALSKKPVTMDISQFPSPHLLPYVMAEGLVSFIGTPLMSKGKVVGAMALGTKKKRIFIQDDLDLMFSIGNVIGIAVENARLYRESVENLQKLQKAYEELQTLDKMKDEFISNVSHELKTPLISIKGYGELLYDEKLGGLSDEQKKSLEAIIRNAERLTRLINSILLISKMAAGKIEFRFEPLGIDEIVSLCAGDFRSMMEKKRITFEKDIPEVSRIRADKDRFIEVITNLFDNAIKFTPEGGKISIKAWDERESVHLTITDNGIGIPSDIIPKLFMRFYQLDAGSARKYGGAGLGLYITKNIMDALHGEIRVESEIGKGTTVHLLLPVARKEI